jgi:hypothetical protein
MSDKRIRLPREGVVEPDDQAGPSELIDTNDVEGHGLPVTAPPAFGPGTPGHGGENIPSPVDDDEDDRGGPTNLHF